MTEQAHIQPTFKSRSTSAKLQRLVYHRCAWTQFLNVLSTSEQCYFSWECSSTHAQLLDRFLLLGLGIHSQPHHAALLWTGIFTFSKDTHVSAELSGVVPQHLDLLV